MRKVSSRLIYFVLSFFIGSTFIHVTYNLNHLPFSLPPSRTSNAHIKAKTTVSSPRNHTAYVNFLIIGVQKAGTTVLFEYLRKHAEIGTPSRRNSNPGAMQNKEIHFFDDETENWAAPNYLKYHLYWTEHDLQKKRVGEASPSYISVFKAMKRIADYNPDMQLIVTLRNPTDRAYSAWWMGVTTGKKHMNFSTAIRTVKGYLRRGFYADQLKRVFQYFPMRQVLILHSEDLRADPLPVLNRVCRFLGISPFTAVAPLVVHERRKNSPMSEEDRKYLDHIFAPQLELLKPIIEENLKVWPP